MEEFKGFGTEAFELWLDISGGNENSPELIKERYKTYITQPLVKLYNRILPSLQSISDDFELSPSRCISSPYTDMRFSRGQKYKNYLYLRFRQRGKENDIYGLYFDMGAEYYSYGFRIYKQTGEGVRAAKNKVTGNIDCFSELIDPVVKKGFEIYGDDYKKDRYPDVENPDVKKILNKSDFYIGKRVKVNKRVFSAELADEIVGGFLSVGGIYNFLKT